MLHTSTPKKIWVMFTPFRDGLQSLFGGKARADDNDLAGQLATEQDDEECQHSIGFHDGEVTGAAPARRVSQYRGE